MTSEVTSHLGFRVVKVGARPLLAIPRADSRIRAAAVRCYPAHTWKKRIVRSVLGLLVKSGLDRLLWRETVTPIEGIAAAEMASWIAEARQHLSSARCQPVVIWPADAARGRAYVYWLDPGGHVAAFGKLALDRKNSDLIHNEERVLGTLAGLQLRGIRVPDVRGAGLLQGFSYLIVETAPSDARITHWEQDPPIADQVPEYAGPERRMPFVEVEAMTWWQRFICAYRDHACVIEKVRRAAAEGVDVCRVHGDLNQTNVLRGTNAIWLLDWERSSECGPCMTDIVCMEVDRLWPRTKQNAADGLKAFLASMWTGQTESRQSRVLLGLAFLCAAEFTPATALLQEWAPQLTTDSSPPMAPAIASDSRVSS